MYEAKTFVWHAQTKQPFWEQLGESGINHKAGNSLEDDSETNVEFE